MGLAGHSMGGQAAAIAAGSPCAEGYGIKAVALHHPASGKVPEGNVGENITVPLISFSSHGDRLCPAKFAEGIMTAAKSPVKAYRKSWHYTHLEPLLIWPICNPLLAKMTAAWFKVFLNDETGGYWKDLIFGDKPESLCKSMSMVECYRKLNERKF